MSMLASASIRIAKPILLVSLAMAFLLITGGCVTVLALALIDDFYPVVDAALFTSDTHKVQADAEWLSHGESAWSIGILPDRIDAYSGNRTLRLTTPDIIIEAGTAAYSGSRVRCENSFTTQFSIQNRSDKLIRLRTNECRLTPKRQTRETGRVTSRKVVTDEDSRILPHTERVLRLPMFGSGRVANEVRFSLPIYTDSGELIYRLECDYARQK